MSVACCILVILQIIVYQAWTVNSQCNLEISNNITISFSHTAHGNIILQKCWEILNWQNEEIVLEIKKFETNSYNKNNCGVGSLNITLIQEEETLLVCDEADIKNPIVTHSSRIQISYFLHTGYVPDGSTSEFTVYYEKFRVREAFSKAVGWLKSKGNVTWGWKENTPRAVTALFLAGDANFNGSSLEEELMAKQTELRTSVALLKDPLSSEELSIYINGLLVTCHSPRHFYGQNLLKRLKDQMKASNDFIHPIAYLTLCNANEPWPQRAYTDLHKILNSDSEYPFLKDFQAFSVMAVLCYENKSESLNETEISHLQSQTERVIKQFKEHQLSDGSFGNAHTTSLIVQALFASGHSYAKDWSLNATMRYLIKEVNLPSFDFLSNYLILPILNRKSLLDISKVDCSTNPRRHGDDDIVPDIDGYQGSKMQIHYSLFLNDDKDIIHTISLRVPENYTAFEVMERVAMEDNKYKFEWKRVLGKIYVYKIGKVMNDPEAGKFWLLYLKSKNSTNTFKHLKTSPDQLILKEDDHLVLWYKKARI